VNAVVAAGEMEDDFAAQIFHTKHKQDLAFKPCGTRVENGRAWHGHLVWSDDRIGRMARQWCVGIHGLVCSEFGYSKYLAAGRFLPLRL
jgi:hypothetical protein